jgi:ribulose bisphosphate carboxylase small subunit
MVELSWPTPVVTQEHLQNLVSQGYMIAVELATCRVPVDPASPTTVVGFIVVCLAF